MSYDLGCSEDVIIGGYLCLSISTKSLNKTCYNASGSKTSRFIKNASKLTPTSRGGQSIHTSHLPTYFICK